MEKVDIYRYIFNTEEGERSTIGDLFIDDEWFCYTLEDEIRSDGGKIKHKTAIPAGKYKVMLTYSPRFKRQLPLIWNTEGKDGSKWVAGKGGDKWTGVRFHGGKDEDHSSGCPLIGFWTNGVDLDKSATNPLVAKMEKGKVYDLEIHNKIFDYKGHFEG